MTGTRLSENEKELFFRALSGGKVRTLSGYLDSGADVNMRDSHEQTLLIRATNLEKEDIRCHVIRMLMRYGADVNLQDTEGRTALMFACMHKGKEDVVRRLIGTGKCDMNMRDDNGNTGLLHAVIADNSAVIRILVNSAHTKGTINVNIENNRGESPLRLAMDAGFLECCHILVKEGNADTSKLPNKDKLDSLLGTLNESDASNYLKSLNKTNVHVNNGISKSSVRLDKISLHSRNSLETEDSQDAGIGTGSDGEERSSTPMPTEDQYPILKPVRLGHYPPNDSNKNYGTSKDTYGKYALSPRSMGDSLPTRTKEEKISVTTVHHGARLERGVLSPILSAAPPRDPYHADLGPNLPPIRHSLPEKTNYEFTDISLSKSTPEYHRQVTTNRKEAFLKQKSTSHKRFFSDSDRDLNADRLSRPSLLSRGRLSPVPTVRQQDPYDGDDEKLTTNKQLASPRQKNQRPQYKRDGRD